MISVDYDQIFHAIANSASNAKIARKLITKFSKLFFLIMCATFLQSAIVNNATGHTNELSNFIQNSIIKSDNEFCDYFLFSTGVENADESTLARFKVLKRIVTTACRSNYFEISADDRNQNGAIECNERRIFSEEEIHLIMMVLSKIARTKADQVDLNFYCVEIESITITSSPYYSPAILIDKKIRSLRFQKSHVKNLLLQETTIGASVEITESLISSLDIQRVEISHNLMLKDVKLESISVIQSKIEKDFIIHYIIVQEKFSLSSIIVGGNLTTILTDIGEEGLDVKFDEDNPRVPFLLFGNFSILGSKISDAFVIFGAVIEGDYVRLEYNSFGSFALFNSHLLSSTISIKYNSSEHHFSLLDSKFKGPAELNNNQTKYITIKGGVFNKGLDMSSCVAQEIKVDRFEYDDKDKNYVPNVIEREFDLSNCRAGRMSLRDLSIDNFVCRDCKLDSDIILSATIKGKINLSGAQANGALYFDCLIWSQNSNLSLYGTKFARIHANYNDMTYITEKGLRDFVPTNLSGARYDLLGGSENIGKNCSDNSRPLPAFNYDEIIRWLRPSLKGNFDPQPFLNISKVLSEAGYKDTANDINSFRVGQSLKSSDNYINYIKYAVGVWIGFGYKPELVVGFLVLLISSGTCVAFICLAYDKSDIGVNNEISLAQTTSSHGFRIIHNIPRMLLSSLWCSVLRLSPDLSGLITSLSSDRIDQFSVTNKWNAWIPIYFRAHRIIGTILIFVLLTPVVGLFD